MNIEQARFNMIQQQVRPWNVLDDQILELLEEVKREDFCPAEHRDMAFMDLEIPIGHGQVMLTPRVQARLVQDLQLKPTDKVLQIGTGTGYMTALLASRSQQVQAFEIHPELVKQTADNLRKAGISNVDLRHGDGLAGALANGPYDAIVLCGSVPAIPHELQDKLATGGRLIGVVGHEPMMHVHLVTRANSGTFDTVKPWDVISPRLEGFPEVSRFRF